MRPGLQPAIVHPSRGMRAHLTPAVLSFCRNYDTFLFRSSKAVVSEVAPLEYTLYHREDVKINTGKWTWTGASYGRPSSRCSSPVCGPVTITRA